MSRFISYQIYWKYYFQIRIILRLTIISICLIISNSLPSIHGQQVQSLTGGYDIHKDRITLSGLSTGGTFAQIVHFAHSKQFSGIGIFSAFFWKCGDYSANLEAMYATCGKPGGYDTMGAKPVAGGDDPELAIKTLKEYSNTNQIDKLSNLAPQKLFIWQGTIDEYVTPVIGLSIINLYEPYFYSPDQIYTKVQYAHHHFPTLHSGTYCPVQSDSSKDAYLGNCQYFGAYHMLNFLIARSSYELREPRTNQGVRRLIRFDQTEFMKDKQGKVMSIGLADTGFLYVPSECSPELNTKWIFRKECYLHFYFHGCFLTEDQVGLKHIIGNGLTQVAELNNIIVVFVMAKVTKFNSGGCFDSFGYTGTNYATKRGPQVKAVMKMMQRFMNDRTIDIPDDDDEPTQPTPIINRPTTTTAAPSSSSTNKWLWWSTEPPSSYNTYFKNSTSSTTNNNN